MEDVKVSNGADCQRTLRIVQLADHILSLIAPSFHKTQERRFGL